MAKAQKPQETKKATVLRKNHGTKGNFPASKTWVTFNGGTKKEVVLCTGNFEPMRTGDNMKDAETMRAYRENYRAELRKLAKQKPVKPVTFFDLYVLNGGKEKHPKQLAGLIVRMLGYSHNSTREIRII